MSQAIKSVSYEVSLYQYISHVEEYPNKEEKFFTQWENNSMTLLAVIGEEDVALLLGEHLAQKLDRDRTLAVWAHGNCRSVTVRVTKIVTGQVPEMLLRLSSYKDNPVGELIRTDPSAPEPMPKWSVSQPEVPDFESVLF